MILCSGCISTDVRYTILARDNNVMAFNSETTRVITAVLKHFWAQQDSESHFKQVSFLLGYIYNYSRGDKKSGCKRNVYARLQT